AFFARALEGRNQRRAPRRLHLGADRAALILGHESVDGFDAALLLRLAELCARQKHGLYLISVVLAADEIRAVRLGIVRGLCDSEHVLVAQSVAHLPEAHARRAAQEHSQDPRLSLPNRRLAREGLLGPERARHARRLERIELEQRMRIEGLAGSSARCFERGDGLLYRRRIRQR